MKKKVLERLAAVILVCAAAFALAACSSGTTEDTASADVSADASGDASGDAEEEETILTADLTFGQETVSMLFENATGLEITGLAVREIDAEVDEDDESEGFSKIKMGGETWNDGQTAEIFVDVYEIESDADASGDVLDPVFNVCYDMRVKLEDGTKIIVHDVTFSELISVMELRYDEEYGLIYLAYEEDGVQITTQEEEIEIYEEELAAAEAAAEAEAAAKAAEEAASSSSSSGSSGSSSGSSSYDSGSSSSSSSSQSSDSCVSEGDLIFN